MDWNEDSVVGGAEERLNYFLIQLQSEYAILDGIVYKNTNQHRRGSYFQYLMKVRRDLRMLLQSVKLEEILVQSFYVIDGKRQNQKLSALESLKKTARDSGKYNFMERLLGAAQLLSQSVEPMLKAARSLVQEALWMRKNLDPRSSDSSWDTRRDNLKQKKNQRCILFRLHQLTIWCSDCSHYPLFGSCSRSPFDSYERL